MINPDEPTYWTEVDGEGLLYHCAYCADQGTEHHTTDLAFFTMHMEQRHDGRMLEGAEPAMTMAAPSSGPASEAPPSVVMPSEPTFPHSVPEPPEEEV